MRKHKCFFGVLLCMSVVSLGLSSSPAGAPGPFGTAEDPPEGVEPQAGSWKTWVLTSGSELRLPAPPDQEATAAETQELKTLTARRDAAALERVNYWDAGPAPYRWVELAAERILSEPIKANNLHRHLGVLTVAIYDATVAAWDSKYAYKRSRPVEVDRSLTTVLPTPHSPSYPSEHAAVAGAATTVLAYLYPEDARAFADLAEDAGRSRLLAGVHYPSDVKAGLDLGRAVGAKVVERAKADGYHQGWEGTVASGPGMWNGTNPVFPSGGTWKPWVLTSGSQFRPGPPPAHDSPQKLAELAEIKNYQRTFVTNAKAFAAQTPDGTHGSWYAITGQRLLEYRVDDNTPKAARAYALLGVALTDSVIACWDAKYAYWAIRPSQLDPEVKTLFPSPNHPSYPAAHACVSAAAAEVIAYLFPREAESIRAKAEDNAWSRLWAGIHYRSDIEAGLELGRQVALAVLERAKHDGAP